MKRVIFLLLGFVAALILSCLLFAQKIYAAVLTISCSESNCSSSPDKGAVFSETNILPLDSVNKEVLVQNTSTQTLDFAVEVKQATFSDSTPSLAQVLTITIREKNGSIVYGPKTIEQWTADGFVILSRKIA
jgi:hypothetical protein